MSAQMYLLTICLPLGTILLVFGMRYFAQIQQAKASLANDSAFRELVEKVKSAGTENSAVLASIETSTADIRERLNAIETILTQVE